MKNRLYQLIIFTLILASFSSCQNRNETHQIRRFCFGFSSKEILPLELDQLSKNKINKQELSKIGLEALEIYQQDTIIFMICDGDINLSYESLMTSFNNLESVDADVNVLKNLMLSGCINLLDRNYKLEQKSVYDARQGQLIAKSENHKRYVLTLEIINDPELLKEYKKIHAMGQAWSEINNNMRSVGIKDMEIYLWDYRAFLIMDTKADFNMQKDGDKWSTLPREKEWQEYVSKFQKVDPESKATEKWVPMGNL